MTGYDYILQSLEILEASLSEESPEGPIRTASALAGKTGYSVYHFSRLFSEVCGIAPGEYIQGRILSLAARRIATTDIPLGIISEQSGFSEYGSFLRAFKRRFGMSPRSLRTLRLFPEGMQERIVPDRSSGGLFLSRRQPETVQVNETFLAGMWFYMEPGTLSFHQPWARFMKVQHRVRERRAPEVFYQYSAWTDEAAEQGLSILCGLEVEPRAEQEPCFVTRRIPPSACLRFVHTGDILTIGDSYRYIYRHFLAENDIRPADFWEFQRYPRPEGTTEIYIPVA